MPNRRHRRQRDDCQEYRGLVSLGFVDVMLWYCEVAPVTSLANTLPFTISTVLNPVRCLTYVAVGVVYPLCVQCFLIPEAFTAMKPHFVFLVWYLMC